MILAETIHSILVFLIFVQVYRFLKPGMHQFSIFKTEFLKILKLRSYRTCCLKSWSFVKSLKNPALFLESPVQDIKFSHQPRICKKFLRMKSVLLNTESVLHKTPQIVCLLTLILHSFSSPSLWQPCYSLKDDVSDLTFPDTLCYSWAYEKTVVPLMWSCMMLLLEKCQCSFDKGFRSLKICTRLRPVCRSTSCRASTGEGTALPCRSDPGYG